MMTWIVLVVLREVRPLWFYILAATLFVLSQVDYFLLNKVRDVGMGVSMWRLTLRTPGDLQRYKSQN